MLELKGKPLKTLSKVDVFRLTKCVKTAISSKQLGCEGPLAKLVAQACVQAMPPTASRFDVDNVRVTKAFHLWKIAFEWRLIAS